MPVSLFPRLEKRRDGKFRNSRMLAEIRDFDWNASAVGVIDHWPDCIKHAARTMLLSSAPMTVLIGRQGIVTYNDAVRTIFGKQYEGSLGKPIAEVLPQAGDFYRSAIDAVFAGEASSFVDRPLRIERDGSHDTAWFNLDFTPIADEEGTVHGVLLISHQTTERVCALRDLRRSKERLDLALSGAGIVGTWEVDFETGLVRSDAQYARLHGVDPEIARDGAGMELFTAAIHPEDRDAVLADFERVKLGGDYRRQHRVVGFDGVRWIVASGRTVLEGDGHPSCFLGVVVDVTEQVRTAAALAESERRFRTFTEALPQIVFSTDAAGRIDYFNRRWRQFTGRTEGSLALEQWRELIHPDEQDAFGRHWQHALRTGAQLDIDVRHLHLSGEHRWVRIIALPLASIGNYATRWLGTLTDIHAMKLLDIERELVSRELDHRIKNLFAIVNALIGLTLRETGESGFVERLRDRLSALDTAHGMIRSRSRTAIAEGPRTSLHELVRQLVAPYVEAGRQRRFIVKGDDVAIHPGAATPLALIFHELTTNAVKYGALNAAGGRIRLKTEKAGEALMLSWEESGVADAALPDTSHGFGSRLLDLVVTGQLRGKLVRDAGRQGLRVRIEIPIQAISDGRG